MLKSCGRCGKIHDANYKCPYVSPYKKTDDEKLRSKNAWTQKSLEIRERANYLCEVCRKEGIYNHESVEVHHIIKLRKNPRGLLDNLNLVCLCKEHHRQADNDEIEIDYLLQLAKERENKKG